MCTAKKLLQFTGEAIREWNWPLVVDGEISREELEDEIAERVSELANQPVETIAFSLLAGLPDEAFGYA